MMVLPLVFITVVSRFPIGLVIYWMTTNLWTVGQGLVTRRLVPKTPTPRRAAALRPPARSARRATPPQGEAARRQRRAAPSAASRSRRAAAAAARQAQEGRRRAGERRRARRSRRPGETVGEAKWKALRELERLAPGLDKASVAFQVVSEGERGLLGVGYTPARVVATAAAARPPAEPAPPRATRASSSAASASSSSGSSAPSGSPRRVDVREDDERDRSSTCTGGDLGLLIGRHGQTIDALQYLANAARPPRRARTSR